MSSEEKKTKEKDPELMLKMTFVVVGVIIVLAFIVGRWLWNLVFDPEHFDVNKWASNEVINSSITLIMMVLGFIAVAETSKGKETSKFCGMKEEFNDIVEEMYNDGSIVYFDQFVPWQAERQLFNKKVRHLTKNGMGRMEAEAIIKYAKIGDIETISGVKPGSKDKKKKDEYGKDIVRQDADGNDVLIPAIKASWAPYVEDVLTGRISIDVSDPSAYTSIGNSKHADLASLERTKADERERVKAVRKSFISKIITGLVMTGILGLLVVNLSTGATTSEALWSFLQNIISAVTGFAYGGFTGALDIRFLIKIIKDNMRVLREYKKCTDLNLFKPQSFEQTMGARIKAVKEEEKKARENVVIVESPLPALPASTRDTEEKAAV